MQVVDDAGVEHRRLADAARAVEDRQAGRAQIRRDDLLLGGSLVVLDADEPVEAWADVVDRGLAGRPRLAVLRRRPRLLRVA